MKNKFYISEFKNYLRGNKLFTNIFLVSSFIMIVLLILFFNYFIYAFFSFDPGDFKVGEPAKRNYVLKSDISFYNEFETNLAKKVEEQLVLPVYKIDKQVNETIISNFNIIKRRLIPLLSSIKNLDLVKEVFNTELSGFFSESEILGLYSLDPELLFTLTLQELQRILYRGYISSEYQVQSSNSGLISVITTTEDNTIIETVSAVSVLQSLRLSNLNNEPYISYISKFLNYFIKVNCYYDVEQTKYNREMSTNKVQAVTDYYRNGEILIRKDFVVTSDLYKRVLLAEASIKRDTISKVLLVIGYVFILFAAGFILFSESFTQKKIKERDLILLLGVTLFYTLFSVLLKYFIYTKYSFLYPLILPTVLISMLVTFLLGNRFGVYLSVLYGFLILLITDFSIYSFTITLIVSILSTVIIHDVERRIDLIKASGELAILQTLLVLYMISVGLVSSSNILLTVIFSVSSSIISGILTLSLLPLFEHALRIPTCFQLAELCDLNAPLLKSMLIKAPGTYAHSISVANMAESAAQHIGANALLSKAGGYYHDIGKIDQPLYFIENQKGGKNLHDDMKPSLSVAVIKSHVKLGIEKAKKIGLPREIIDIIEQHHGKGSIMYFLDKAKKESKGNNILSEDFCYSGPNPASPEAAIVMLADSVEAAVRSLKNPTISQLEKFVWDLILNKLKDGMLDACGLTLSDLTTIKDSFINTLMGHYHSRIEYPTEVKKGE